MDSEVLYFINELQQPYKYLKSIYLVNNKTGLIFMVKQLSILVLRKTFKFEGNFKF